MFVSHYKHKYGGVYALYVKKGGQEGFKGLAHALYSKYWIGSYDKAEEAWEQIKSKMDLIVEY